jgi:organic hydroperoxide reductase OsmC/OhrA
MSGRTHTYTCNVTWTGNSGTGTSGYTAYSRDHVIAAHGKPEIPGSSDPAFRGDGKRYNPEDLLLASVSTCHMLWYLHLCADAKVTVIAYEDTPTGTMVEDAKRGGWFTGVTLRPRVTIARGSDPAKARELHHAAHEKCYVANSVNFPVSCEPEIIQAER